jgi:hypothetical protein
MNRKQRRAGEARAKKGGSAEDALSTQTALFSKLPEECLMCETPYDKTDIAMVSSWNVVVREDQGVVRLYCPDCWTAAQKVVTKFKNGEL